MSFWDKLKDRLPKAKKEEQKLLKGLDAVKETYDEVDGREAAIKASAQKAIQQMELHPEMSAVELIKMIQDDKELPIDVVVKIAKQIPEVRQEETVVKIAEEVDLPIEGYKEIIQDADVSLSTAQKIAEQIPDEGIKIQQQEELKKQREEKIYNNLQELYKDCVNMNDLQTVDRLGDYKYANQPLRIKEQVRKILARRTAIDCLDFGGPKIETIARVISADELLEIEFDKRVSEEYLNMRAEYEDKNKPYHEYDRNLVKGMIIENVAKGVAKDFDEAGYIKVPQSDAMNNLTENEEQIFIKTMKHSCKKEVLTEKDIMRVRKQIRGDISNELEDIEKMLGKMSQDDRETYVTMFKQIIQSKSKSSPEEMQLQESIVHLNEQINQLPKGEAITTAKMMSQILEDRKKAKRTLKVERVDNVHEKDAIPTEYTSPKGEER